MGGEGRKRKIGFPAPFSIPAAGWTRADGTRDQFDAQARSGCGPGLTAMALSQESPRVG